MKKETTYSIMVFIAFLVLAALGTMTAYNDDFYQEVGSSNKAKVEVLNDTMLLLVERSMTATVIKNASSEHEALGKAINDSADTAAKYSMNMYLITEID